MSRTKQFASLTCLLKMTTISIKSQIDVKIHLKAHILVLTKTLKAVIVLKTIFRKLIKLKRMLLVKDCKVHLAHLEKMKPLKLILKVVKKMALP